MAAVLAAIPCGRAQVQSGTSSDANNSVSAPVPSNAPTSSDPVRCFDRALSSEQNALQAYQLVYSTDWASSFACRGQTTAVELDPCWNLLMQARPLTEQAAREFEGARHVSEPTSLAMIQKGNALIRNATNVWRQAQRCFAPIFAKWVQNGGVYTANADTFNVNPGVGGIPGEPAINRFGRDAQCGGTNRVYYDRMYGTTGVVMSAQQMNQHYRAGEIIRCGDCSKSGPGMVICWLKQSPIPPDTFNSNSANPNSAPTHQPRPCGGGVPTGSVPPDCSAILAEEARLSQQMIWQPTPEATRALERQLNAIEPQAMACRREMLGPNAPAGGVDTFNSNSQTNQPPGTAGPPAPSDLFLSNTRDSGGSPRGRLPNPLSPGSHPPGQRDPNQQTTQVKDTGCWTGLPAGKLCTENGYFYDNAGRVVILRGVNLAGTSKIPPFLPLPPPGGRRLVPPMQGDIMLTREFNFVANTYLNDLAPLPRWGVNVIRLLFIWEAYEPLRGEKSESYLEMLDRIVDAAWQRGIYTIIDFHQDVFSRWMAQGCGEGFPQWTQLDPTLNRPRNDASCTDWMSKGIMDPEMHRNFNRLYHGALKRDYLSVINTLVQRYADKPGVIGFDVLNEPFASIAGLTLQGPNFRDDIMSLQTVDDSELSAFYHDVADHFKDKRTILFLEPDLFVDTGVQSMLRAPGNFAQVAYAPHFYDPDISPPMNRFRSMGRVEDAFHNMSERARSWGAPLFIGEFGAAAGTGNAAAYMDSLHAAMNEYFASGAQWSYTPGWTPEAKDGWNAEDLSIVAPGSPDEGSQGYRPLLFQPRAYPQAIAGWPQRLTVRNSANGGFQLQLLWTHRPGTRAATVIFIPQSPSLVQASGGRLSIEARGATLAEMNCWPQSDRAGVVRVFCRAMMSDRRTLQVTVTGQ